ncbi:ribosomal protein L11 methyltransferase (plasmid) [Legionella adelaidensis]|uniref:Ribosomal protein L11 methyltransferase n=1 Tax=Legionella adelaidensis TaxID=45056 RepID=A0A0W0R2T0_9GAMM|nr:50S ribosomal protein L11 methyltransferase [Legionella adelaidensis]KTC65368.1 ribosomal protein L11 methyltransferase [Legionella adelaidensis]VEH84810.1 ribosomal protein L11 methyltransferase [Legionella adelaidensis]
MFELQVSSPESHAEPLCALLESLGALSITMTDKHDHPILEPELGTSPLWPEVVINALFEDIHQAQFAQQMIEQQSEHPEMVIKEIQEQDWERTCLVDFKPLQFGDHLWVCPSWTAPPDPNATNLILDPGLAFGTGNHQTTALCLKWLGNHSVKELEVIDYGCGSGILALAALKLHAKKVYAVDIDPQALIATENNAQSNNLLCDSLFIGKPDELKKPVDLILANILLGPLIELRFRLKELLKPGGLLVVSGILEEQINELKNAYEGVFTPLEENVQEGWALIGWA